MTAYTYKLDQKGIPYRVPAFGTWETEERESPEQAPADSFQPEPEILQHRGKQQAFQLYVI